MRNHLPRWHVPTDADFIRIGIFLAALGLLALVSGCGGPAGPGSIATPTPTATATPAPTPTPAFCPKPTSCPALTRFGNKAHNVMNERHQDIANEVCNADRSRCRIPVGGFIVYDSTPGFGPNSDPCNGEHGDACRAICANGLVSEMRRCEPETGPLWGLTGPAEVVQFQENYYQVKVRITGAGTIRTRTCANPEAVNGEGEAVEIAPGNCFTRVMDVEN